MLRNLTIIDAAQREIKRRTGKQIPLWTKEILNDKKALKMISNGDTNGVFQLESDGMKKFMRQLQPDCFEDIIAGVALYRPGPMDYIPEYIRNKHNPKGIVYDTPELKSILESTYGIIVYQEQVMLIVQKLAGFSMGRADVVRKAMGKKKQEIMDQEGPHFICGDEKLGIDGCAKRGISKAVATKIWDQMVDFAKYAFNKSHAAAYAAISLQTAFLKANYPLEFAMGLLTSVMDNSDKLMKYVNAYRLAETKILPPDVQKSQYGFSIETDENGVECIRFGLFAIKKVGDGIAKSIPAERAAKPYTSLYDFIEALILSSMPPMFWKEIFSCLKNLSNVFLVTFEVFARKSCLKIFSSTSTGKRSPSTVILLIALRTINSEYSNDSLGSTSSPTRYVHFAVILVINFSALSSKFTISVKFQG